MGSRQFVTTGDLRIEEEVDLEKCHTDPIHETAMIQPHGVFFQLDSEDLTVLSCSRNLHDFLDFDPGQTLNRQLQNVVGEGTLDDLNQVLNRPVLENEYFVTDVEGDYFLAAVFEVGETVGLELVPHHKPDRSSTELLFRESEFFKRINRVNDMDELLDELCELVKITLGYDRVLLLRFEHHGHGHVIAESGNETMRSYLDQYFPASDVPEPARRVYKKNGLRYIPRSRYDPVPIVGGEGRIPREELDLTFSNLRNVPLVHRKYLSNMGVGASTSVPLIINDELWGLITAHNSDDGFVTWNERHFCTRIGQFASTKIERLEAKKRERMHLVVENFRDDYLKSEKPKQNLFKFLRRARDDVLGLLDANGFFIQFNGRTFWMTEENIDEPSEELLGWIESRLRGQNRITVDSIENQFDRSWDESRWYSGFVAVNFTQRPNNYCIWFRPEQESEIKWGGDPRSALTIDESQELSPRNSFEEWTQIVQGQCERWTEMDDVVANDLIQIFNEVALGEQTDRLREANVELEAQNEELQEIKELLEEKNKKLNEANERLEELSYYDELTGIPNRRQFEQALKTKWGLLKRNAQPISLIMIDLDYFKEFNDTYGHQKGDECLQKVSRVLRDCARRESDTVARYGGEEFVVILPDTRKTDAIDLAEEMREAVRGLGIPHESSDVSDVVTVSLGVASYDDLHDKTQKQLIEDADDALYDAKQNGRNRVAG